MQQPGMVCLDSSLKLHGEDAAPTYHSGRSGCRGRKARSYDALADIAKHIAMDFIT